jgi:hypothetical protein
LTHSLKGGYIRGYLKGCNLGAYCFYVMFTNMENRFKNTPRFLSHPKHKLAIIKTLTLRNLTKKPFLKKNQTK